MPRDSTRFGCSAVKVSMGFHEWVICPSDALSMTRTYLLSSRASLGPGVAWRVAPQDSNKKQRLETMSLLTARMDCMSTGLPHVIASVHGHDRRKTFAHGQKELRPGPPPHGTLKPNSAAALAVVTSAIFSTGTPLSSASFFAVSTTYEGSFFLPR